MKLSPFAHIATAIIMQAWESFVEDVSRGCGLPINLLSNVNIHRNHKHSTSLPVPDGFLILLKSPIPLKTRPQPGNMKLGMNILMALPAMWGK